LKETQINPRNQLKEKAMNKAVVQTALIALGAFAIASLIQKKMMPIPVIGQYLPGGTTPAA